MEFRAALRTAHTLRAARPLARAARPVLRQSPPILPARTFVTAPRWAEHAGPKVTATNRAEVTLRRFWKNVDIAEEDGGYIIKLDHRTLKTPDGAKLIVPKDRLLLALLIVNEWENQDKVLKQHALPMTSLASRAIDGMNDPKVREGVVDLLLSFLETDTICFPSDAPRTLVRIQHERWDPLYTWLKEKYGVTLAVAEGISVPEQSPETLGRMRAVLDKMSNYELAALERAVYATKSFVIGLALVTGRLTADQAAAASHAEVDSQIERWGEVEDSHDVDHQDIRRALGSAACLVTKTQA